MTRLIFRAVMLLLVGGWLLNSHAQLEVIQPQINGTWFYPVQDGHGFNIQALDENRMLVFWYTYDEAGDSTFLIGIVEDTGSGSYAGTFQRTNGMVFGQFDPDTVIREDWGTIVLTFTDCNNARVSWDSTQVGFPSGSIPIQRLTADWFGTCTDEPVAGNYILTYSDGSDRFDGIGLFLPDGTFFYAAGELALEFIGVGTWQRFGVGSQNLNLNATEYEVDEFGTPPLNTSEESFSTILNVNGFGPLSQSEVAAFGLRGTLQRDYRRSVPMAELAGDYLFIDTTANVSFANLTIDGEGRVSGTAINGCNLGGGMVMPTAPGTNQFSMSVLVDDDNPLCENSDLRGAGYRVDAADPIAPNALFSILINEDTSYASIFRLSRVSD
ncbi:MAG: hypothetical protein AAGH65_12595 [Pseudomonadota bacterium]